MPPISCVVDRDVVRVARYTKLIERHDGIYALLVHFTAHQVRDKSRIPLGAQAIRQRLMLDDTGASFVGSLFGAVAHG